MRTYKPRRRKASPRARMLRAAALRADGLSLRQIGAQMSVSHQTVANLLARLAAAEARVSRLPVKFSPPGGENLTPELDSPGTVTHLRKTS